MPLTSADLASLRYFAATARLLSFKHAAAELHVTQGAVSQQIRHLEASLRCKLFYRLPREVKLTEEGQSFATTVQRALMELDAAAEAAALKVSSVSNLRVRAGPSFALRWLVPRLARFYEFNAEMRLHIIGAYGYFDPAHRDFDIAIELLQGNLPGLHTESFMQEYLLPVCTSEYLAKNTFLKHPSDLARCTLLHDSQAWRDGNKDAEWRHWLQEVGAADIDSSCGQFFTLTNMAIEAALTHQGLAMARLSLITDLLDAGRLVAPFPQAIASPAKYYLVCLKEDADRPSMQRLIRWLHSEAAGSTALERVLAEPQMDLAR
jgi:LysR family transcriptional regulator, glycine cleavage system transcriptional activator